MMKRNRSNLERNRTSGAAVHDGASAGRAGTARATVSSRELRVAADPAKPTTRARAGTLTQPAAIRPNSELQRKTKRDGLTVPPQRAVDLRAARNLSVLAADRSDAVLTGRSGLVHRSQQHAFQKFTPGAPGKPGHFSLAGKQFKDVVLVNQNLSKDPDCYYQTITFHERYQELRKRGASEERALLQAQGFANQRENIQRTVAAYARAPLSAESRRAIKDSLLTGSMGDYGGENLSGRKAALAGAQNEPEPEPEQLRQFSEPGVKHDQSVLIAMQRGGMPSHGSGFLVRPNLILTCAHNVEGNDALPTIVINNQIYAAQSFTIHPQRGADKNPDYDLAVIRLNAPVQGAQNIAVGAIAANGGGLQLLGYPSFKSALVDVDYRESGAELEAMGTKLAALGYVQKRDAKALWDKVLARVRPAIQEFNPELTAMLEGAAWRNARGDKNVSLDELLTTAFETMFDDLDQAKIGGMVAVAQHIATIEKAFISGAYLVAADELRAGGHNTSMLFESEQGELPAVGGGARAFDHKMDAVDGNSGSPIFQGNRLVGVHVRGAPKANTAMSLGGHTAWLQQQL